MKILREFYLKADESAHVYQMKGGQRVYVFNDEGLYFYICYTAKKFFDFLRRGEPSQLQIEGERNLDLYLSTLNKKQNGN